jgi:hypothetical protein
MELQELAEGEGRVVSYSVSRRFGSKQNLDLHANAAAIPVDGVRTELVCRAQSRYS